MDVIDEDSDGIIMTFLDATENFSLGFECGQYWLMLINNIPIEDNIAHRKNIPQLTEMAKLFNKTVLVKELIIDESMPKELFIDINDYVEISFKDVGTISTSDKKSPKLRVIK